MSGEEPRSTCRLESLVTSHEADRSPTTAYDEWADERLVDGYRRNSILLREYGPDHRTIHALCAIEERLRARDIDPEEIVEALDS